MTYRGTVTRGGTVMWGRKWGTLLRDREGWEEEKREGAGRDVYITVLWCRGSREVLLVSIHLPAMLPHLQLAESRHHWLVRDTAWVPGQREHPEHRANHARIPSASTTQFDSIWSASLRKIGSDRLTNLLTIQLLELTNFVHNNTQGRNNQTCLIQDSLFTKEGVHQLVTWAFQLQLWRII